MASSILIDGQKLDLFETSEVVVTLQSNDLGQLKGPQVDFSKSFDAPKTPNNIKILGNPNQPNISEGKEYEINPTVIIIDGFLSMPSSSLKIEETSTIFKLSVQSGGVQFYKFASDNVLNDPALFDWTQYDFNYLDLSILFPFTIGDNMIMSLLGREGMTDIIVSNNADVRYNDMYPSMLVSTMLTNIEQVTGYTFHNLGLLIYTYFSLKDIGSTIGRHKILSQYSLNFQDWDTSDGIKRFVLTHPAGFDEFGTWDGDEYTFTQDGAYTCYFYSVFTDDPILRFQVTMPDGTVHQPNQQGLSFETFIIMNAVVGQKITVQGHLTLGSNLRTHDTIFKIEKHTNGEYITQDGMAEWSILDFIKELAVMQGKLITVDAIRKEVNFLTLDEIYADRINGVDLSKRALVAEPKFIYEAGDFGRNSYMLYSGDFPRRGVMKLNNEWANAEVDIWPAKSGGVEPNPVDIIQTDTTFNFFQAVDYQQGVIFTYNLYDESGIIVSSYAEGTPTDNILPTQLSWQDIINTKYTRLSEMLQRWLQVDLILYLNSEEVEQIRKSSAVFWDSRYWYVNKIGDYKLGRPTKITLIRLPL